MSKLTGKVKDTFDNFRGTAIGGLIAGPIGMHYGSQYDIMKMQNQMQNAQIERQNELNMQMWNLQNEYNSPYNQMQRYKNAGLNPNLIYGSVSSGNATSAPEMSATIGGSNALSLASVISQASGDASKLLKGVASRMLNNYLDGLDLDLAQKSANLANTKAQTKALKSVDTQASSPVLRSDPMDPRNSDPLWTRETPFDNKSIHGKTLNTADTVGRYIIEKYHDWKYISAREQRHRDWIFRKQLDKGKSWEEAERIAYGKNGKYYFR